MTILLIGSATVINQKTAWHQFMLAGDRSEWTSFGEDPTRGGTE